MSEIPATNFANLKLSYDPDFFAMTATFSGTADEVLKLLKLNEDRTSSVGFEDFEITPVSCWGYGTFSIDKAPGYGLDRVVYFGFDPDDGTWRLTIPNTYAHDDLDHTITPKIEDVIEKHWIDAAPVLKQFASYLA